MATSVEWQFNFGVSAILLSWCETKYGEATIVTWPMLLMWGDRPHKEILPEVNDAEPHE